MIIVFTISNNIWSLKHWTNQKMIFVQKFKTKYLETNQKLEFVQQNMLFIISKTSKVPQNNMRPKTPGTTKNISVFQNIRNWGYSRASILLKLETNQKLIGLLLKLETNQNLNLSIYLI